MSQPITAIILAAGKGTRMKSNLSKILHPVAGRAMVSHVIHSAAAIPGLAKVVLITGENTPQVEAYLTKEPAPVAIEIALQKEQLGTGDAVKAALPHLHGFTGHVLILLGDVPLITPASLAKVVNSLGEHVHVSVLGFHAKDPAEYGRLVLNDSDQLEAIVEYKDATSEERRIDLCNSGIMAVSGKVLPELLAEITNHNAKGEYYLTDIIAIARAKGYGCCVSKASEEEVMGVNSRAQLAAAEQAIQHCLRQHAMDNGATLIAPETVYFSYDTVLGQDVVIEPHVMFGPKVSVGNNITIKSFSHIEGATIADRAIIGPFARLRPGTKLAEDVHIGNFVEIKNSTLEPHSKANHLSYIGDASIGTRTNIGAGTITCNYDGYTKAHTSIGSDCFIGSDTSLVAPVSVGNGAIIGAGSTIVEDVPADSIALTRSPQTTLAGKAASYRNKRKKA